jgi:hypothetical protein
MAERFEGTEDASSLPGERPLEQNALTLVVERCIEAARLT